MLTRRVLALGAAAGCAAWLALDAVTARDVPAGLQDWAADTVQVVLGFRSDDGSKWMPDRYVTAAADRWVMPDAMRRALRRADSVVTRVTGQPQAHPVPDSQEWEVDMPVTIEVHIGGVIHAERGTVRITAAEQPDGAPQRFLTTGIQLDP